MSNRQKLVKKLWNCRNILCDEGLPYGDYFRQLTFLLFFKMADEPNRPPLHEQCAMPKGRDCFSLLAKVERRLSVVTELAVVMSINVQRATRLRQFILRNAFTGGRMGTATCKDGLQVQRERR